METLDKFYEYSKHLTDFIEFVNKTMLQFDKDTQKLGFEAILAVSKFEQAVYKATLKYVDTTDKNNTNNESK